MPPIFPNVGQIREEWLACLYTPLSAIGLNQTNREPIYFVEFFYYCATLIY